MYLLKASNISTKIESNAQTGQTVRFQYPVEKVILQLMRWSSYSLNRYVILNMWRVKEKVVKKSIHIQHFYC